MPRKAIKYFVYLLSFLIIIAFFAVIYGIYIKITFKASKNYNIETVTSLLLQDNQKIKDMQVIDKNRFLIIIDNNEELEGIIFDINSQEIIQRIIK